MIVIGKPCASRSAAMFGLGAIEGHWVSLTTTLYSSVRAGQAHRIHEHRTSAPGAVCVWRSEYPKDRDRHLGRPLMDRRRTDRRSAMSFLARHEMTCGPRILVADLTDHDLREMGRMVVSCAHSTGYRTDGPRLAHEAARRHGIHRFCRSTALLDAGDRAIPVALEVDDPSLLKGEWEAWLRDAKDVLPGRARRVGGPARGRGGRSQSTRQP